MLNKLNPKDVRALKIGAIGVVAILVFVFALGRYNRWHQARESLTELQKKINDIDLDKAKRSGLTSVVPVFKMPVEKDKQRFLFLESLNEELRSVNINSQPLQEEPGAKTTPVAGYQLLRLKCSAKCRFGQVLDLLAALKNNPYLVGIEELRIKVDPKNRQQVDFDLTVSTLVK
jgi:hypothetical protein